MKKSASDKSGGDYYNTQVSYKGNRYIETAFGRYYEGSITVSQLSGYMGMTIPNLQTLASKKGWMVL